jgi:DNA-binding LacI/PurR family transcriptional regulator
VRLTTVAQNTQALAEAALSQLLARLEDPRHPAGETVVAPQLVTRATTQPLRPRSRGDRDERAWSR